jgi:hypothetical protein
MSALKYNRKSSLKNVKISATPISEGITIRNDESYAKRLDASKDGSNNHLRDDHEGKSSSKSCSKEIVYSINLKSRIDNNVLFTPTSIRMTSTPTSEFFNALPARNSQLKFYKAFNKFNVLGKKKFINLIELT